MYSSLEISVLIHATEDQEKVVHSITNFLQESDEHIKMDCIKTNGHWKNPIKLLKMQFNKDIDKIYTWLFDSLTANYGENIFDDYLKNNIDVKGSVYIRLDKQKLTSGVISLSENDSIRLTFKKKGRFER